MAKLNKSNIIAKMAFEADISIEEATRAFNAMVSIFGSEIRNGNAISLVGFGTFKPKIVPARGWVIPATGMKTKLPKVRTLSFKPGKILQQAVG